MNIVRAQKRQVETFANKNSSGWIGVEPEKIVEARNYDPKRNQKREMRNGNEKSFPLSPGWGWLHK